MRSDSLPHSRENWNVPSWVPVDKRNPYHYASNADTVLHMYLERQGRNEYINLASQMGYDGSNLAFVFYENQVRRLMDESPYDQRRLEVLWASCIGQPREMINLFCAPMRGTTTALRTEKALSHLCQRYGVTGGLTSEPKIIAIRHGHKVSHTSASLKLFNEDLNTMEVFAYPHGEYNRLTGQLLLDTANRLPNLMKRRYLDYLKKNGVSLNQPSFESLRDFVALEIEMTTSDYAQAFFKSDDKEKPREQSGGRGKFCVCQVTVNSGGGPRQSNATAGSASGTVATSGSKRFAGRRSKQPEKRPPICFTAHELIARTILWSVKCLNSFHPGKNDRQLMNLRGVLIACHKIILFEIVLLPQGAALVDLVAEISMLWLCMTVMFLIDLQR